MPEQVKCFACLAIQSVNTVPEFSRDNCTAYGVLIGFMERNDFKTSETSLCPTHRAFLAVMRKIAGAHGFPNLNPDVC